MIRYVESLRSRVKQDRVLLRSCLVFAACILLFAVAYWRLVGTDPFAGFLAATANISGAVLNLLGMGVTVSGNSLSSRDFSVSVGTGCDGLVPIMIFLSAILAYPSGIRAKLIGMSLGILSLYALNIVRIVSLFYIGSRAYSLFDTMHLLVWQSLLILAAIVLWLYWARRTGHAEAR